MTDGRSDSAARLSRRDLDGLIRRLGKKRPPAAGERLAGEPAARRGIPGRGETGPRVLSFGQQRLWFLDQLQPGSAVYNVPGCLRLCGALDVRALASSLHEIVQRHDTLRTRFAVLDGEPVQRVAAASEPLFTEVDLADLRPAGEAAQRAEVRRLETREARRPFDLARGPLLRVTLLRLDAAPEGGESLLLLTLHHIVADGWSLQILLRELLELYESAVAGREPALAELPISYSDFAVWQRRTLAGKALEKLLGYWREQLHGVPTLELPTDRPRPVVRAQRGALTQERTVATPDAVSRLEALARRHDATLFMALLAAFQVLLARYAGEDDLTVGTPIAGRTRPAIERLIGFFANTLVLRSDLSADPSFAELLGRVREVTLAAFEHQEVPFEKLVEELAPERHLSTTPLTQVALSFAEAPFPARRLTGLEITPQARHSGTAKFDLTLFLTRSAKGLVAELEYDRDLFTEATAERLLGHFGVLLRGIVTAPEHRLSRLPLLGADERRLLLETWNATAAPLPHACAHQLIGERARGAPDAPAVVAGRTVLSYGELDRRANRLARVLRARGVGPEVLVAVLMERSPQMVVALAGILEAGGAYLPLDPASPAERLAFQLNDSGAALTLFDPRQPPPAGLETGRRFVRLDDAMAGDGAARAGAPASGAGSEHLAYVIYTSGSTGRPKGTELTHAGLGNLLVAYREICPLEPGDRSSHVAGPGFDATILELWPALCAGAAIHIPPAERVSRPARLLDWLAERRVTVSFMPTPLAEAALSERLPAGLALRVLLTGGDRLHAAPLSALPFAFWNLYGPTENTVFTTAAPVAAAAPGAGPPPIGRPVTNHRVYILDGQLQPVPIGVPGHLHAAGAGLARGYLRRPRLTSEKLLPDPFAVTGGARLYRTGDLARYLGDGEIEFLGRIDHQVKLQGFRIELGEIETALQAQAPVKEAVVVLQRPPAGSGAGPGAARLVAYLTAAGTSPGVDSAAVRDALRRSLPDYMVPAVFIVLDSLPLTPSGKVDRRALPAPPWREEEAFVAPRTPLEEILAATWSELLGVDRVGVHDNFFELGGHSLLATRLISQLRARCGVELALQRLFEAPTVAGLAAAVDAAASAGAAQLPPLTRAARDGELATSFAQERLWFLEQLQPGSAAYHVPGAVRLRGRLDPAALAGALAAIVDRHEALRTGFASTEDGLLQVVEPRAELALPVVDLGAVGRETGAPEVSRWLAAEARRPFDLTAPPLIRALLLRHARDEHVLLVVIHHIVSDGWSLGVLIRELAALYRAAAATQGSAALSPLPELPVQYPDFAAWQRRWLTGEVLAGQLAYWRRQLRGIAPLELPTDRPRPAARRERGANLPVALPGALSQDLATFSRSQGVTLFMTLLAAFATLLGRYSGQRDVAVGTPIANRRQRELEGLIGLFVNTLVLRADLRGDPEARQLLAQARTTTLAAYAHQDVPFERLVEEVASERDLSRTPLFQVMLVLQNAPFGALRLPGVELEPLAVDTATAKFDLTLFLSETPRGLAGHLEYDRDLFEEATVRRLLHHFETLLAGFAGDGAGRLSELPLIAAAERAQLLGWNVETLSYDGELTLSALFEASAARRPAAAALAGGGERLTYAELDAAANRLAHHLRRRGIGAETTVGICLDRGAELVVAILATLKAGGVYVPLDPSYPRERLAFTLEDAAVALVLTRRDLRQVLPAGAAPLLCLDDAAPALADEPATGPAPVARAGNLAYLIYTSGSTGRPKAVAISHRNASHMVHWALREYPAEALAGVLAATSINFDLSVFEIFVPLAGGGTVIVADNALALASLPEREQVTLVNTVPSAIAELVRSGPLPASVKTVNLAGEPLRRPLADEVYAAGARRLYNLYGPSEDTTYSTAALVAARETAEPTIGRPLPGTRAYLLDRRLEPVPVGVAGELLLAGDGLARGYLGRPALTAERFIPDLFAGPGGGRLYRTGDLARYLADGRLTFLGRLDHQVKVRGFRIELGEIEVALLDHPRVRDAVVTAHDRGGDLRLVAYLTPRSPDKEPPAAADLRAHLAERLPPYMVPAAFVELAALPLLPNGKVDRRRLPAPRWEAEAAAYVAPRTPLEERLAMLWSELLGVERVGVDDSFFALGGHSLLATRLVSRLRADLGVEIEVRKVFEAPALGAFGAAVEAARGEPAPELPPLERQPRGAEVGLSFAQERLWFLEQLHPGGAVYNMPAAVRLTGRLDVAALAAALAAVVRRHETLRTRFAAVEGRPVQVVAPHLELPLAVVDLCALEEERRDAVAAQLVAAEGRRPFDLAALPLLRAALLRLGGATPPGDEHVLLINMHHIISDGWSLGVLIRELAHLYRSAADRPDRAMALPELPVQYADFALWQRRWLRDGTLEDHLDYWRIQLAGLEPLELPADRPRPAAPRHRGATVRLALTSELSQALADLGRRRGTTLFMTLLSLFSVTLSRAAGGCDEVAVGSPIANRNRREIEDLIGFFVNTLVLRVDLRGDPPLPELLSRVRRLALDAQRHQDAPFEKVVEALPGDRDLATSPLFQVMLALQNAPLELALPGLAVEQIETSTGTAKFDLTVVLHDSARGLVGTLEYDRDLFERATVERLWQRFAIVLAGAVADPERRISELPFLSPGERRQLLRDWNRTATAYPRDRSIHSLFEEQAAARPEATAVVAGDERLSYGELNRRANRLAHRLIELGVGSDARVALCVERSPAMLVATVAVLKAGGAYVPLDPGYPRERLAFMFADTAAAVLVFERSVAPRLPDPLPAGLARLTLEELAREVGGRPDSDPASPVGAANLAYVMYTSGSTGRPKGVAVSHRNVVRLVKETDYIDFGHDQVFVQNAPISFDAATLEIWGPLLNGGTLALAPAHLTSLAELGNVLERCRVTSLWLTAGLFHQMVEEHPDGLAGVRQLMTGGETVSPGHARAALEHLAGGTLLNCYGPTEGTTYTTTQAIADPAQAVGSSISIGRPINNTTAYVVDRRFRPAGVGVPGHLVTGGDGVARGYLGRPRLTAAAFVPDPFSPRRGARLYCTGDLARYLADGRIDFLGRIDRQVKIRGFRIEPGEIEAVLSDHPLVGRAVVVLRSDAPGASKVLVAYVTAESVRSTAEGALDAAELRGYLKARFPDYMVPAAFVVLAELPLGATGKVDQRALPPPAWRDESVERVAPRTEVEKRLAAIWAEVLGRGDAPSEALGVHESFFELGGHSLLATQVVSRLHRDLGVEVPLARLFEAPTIAGLAPAVEASLAREEAPPEPAIAPLPRDHAVSEGFPLSFAQERLWILSRLEPDNPAYNIPGAVHLCGELEVSALAGALDALVARHESLRTVFASVAGQPVQRILPPAPQALPVVDLAALPAADRDRELARRLAQDPLATFDLERGPLFYARLLCLGGREAVLAVNIHHIISDGWSFSILVRELGTLYSAALSGHPPALPPLAAQYADYAVWQRNWLSGEVLERQLAYWRRQLAGVPEALELPVDRLRPAIQTYHGDQRRRTIAAELGRRLDKLGRRATASLFMVLLAAFKVLMGRLAGVDDVAVGIPIAGRHHADTESLIGIFLNNLVLRTDLSGNPSFAELTSRLREVALAAYAHQDLPFERLLDELKPERDLSRTPLFQVFFNMLNLPSADMRLAGLDIERVTMPEQLSKFDLTLYVDEHDGELDLDLVYNADLFSARRIEILLDQYESLLRQVADVPETPIAELDLVTAETRALLPRVEEELDGTWHGAIHELFAVAAQRADERVAVVDQDGRWSYRQLEEQSNRVAHWLLGAGLEKGQAVTIYAQRSAPLVWAVLGTLKAGGVFVLLDPTYPGARLADLVRRSQPGAWLALAAAGKPPAELDELLGELGCPRLELAPWRAGDGDLGDLADMPTTPPGVAIGPDDLACIAFTSGSTGEPKGILGRHGPLSHFLPFQQERFGLGPGDRYSLLSGLAHDPLQRDIFTPLGLGGTIVIPDPRRILTAGYLAEWIAGEGVNVAHLTPAMGRLIVDGAPPEAVGSLGCLRRVFLVGDVLSWRDVERLRRLAPAVTCVNLYGSTETQRAVGFFEPRPEDGGAHPGQQILPLGRGMRDVQLLVLGTGDRLAGVGELGEICVRSPHLARGYLGDETLTRERFQANPFVDGGSAGDRIYRTGDLGRYLPDGNVVFAGRADRQVKIRGFRIELGEIEAVLERHPEVVQAVVEARTERGSGMLAAWWVAAPGSEVQESGLRRFLQRHLPAYMVPLHFFPLEALPLTPNRKVDRAALARRALPLRKTEHQAPASELERRLAEVWREVLEIEQVGVTDNFFDLGGQSLLLVRLHGRLQEVLGIDLKLMDLFSYPDIRSLAEHLRSHAGDARQGVKESRSRARRQIAAARRQKQRAARVRS